MESSLNTLIDDLLWPTAEATRTISAVAKGDLSQLMRLEVEGRPIKGEFLRSATLVNTMIDQMRGFTSEVTRAAREVGTEGKLGGQAVVPGAAGTWKDLTANVNLLAANLTTQVRAIAKVATAVTKGELTRSIQVNARGEVSELKDNINAMIGTLKVTTERNTEQDWLKTNLAKFSRMMQGQRDLVTVGNMLLAELAPLVNSQHGVVYVMDSDARGPILKQLASYADVREGPDARCYQLNEGLVGQCAADGRRILLESIPEQSVHVTSGLLSARARSVIALPVLYEGQVKAVIELASLHEFTAPHLAFLEQLTGSIGVVLNTIEATMRTERLLQQSQELAAELQAQQRELQQTNEELARRALAEANANLQIEKARELESLNHSLQSTNHALKEADRRKDEFLAILAHELRNPLAALSAATRLMQRQVQKPEVPAMACNAVQRQVGHMVRLLDDLLDVSRISHGRMQLQLDKVEIADVVRSAIDMVRPQLEAKQQQLGVNLGDRPAQVLGDTLRLIQIVANLLNNSVKYTPVGGRIEVAVLAAAGEVSISVRDDGIGIAPGMLDQVFDMFSQAGRASSEAQGGLGIGLALVKGLVRLHQGSVRAHSAGEGKGSEFRITLPLADPGAIAQPSSGPAADAGQIRPLRVLIADDNVDSAISWSVLIGDSGHRVVTAYDGMAALRMAEEFRPEVALLDIGMPRLDGYEVARRIRATDRGRDALLVAVTGWGQAKDRELAYEAGFDEHFTKPMDPAQLERTLRKASLRA